MSLRPIGGIFWRPDASGNLTAYDTSGNILGKFIGGVFSGVNNTVSVTSNPGVTSNHVDANDYSTGVGLSIKPIVSTRILIVLVATLDSGGAVAATGNQSIYRNTTSIPAANAAATGTNIVSQSATNWVALYQASFTLSFLDTGLTVGTTYNYYYAYNQSIGTANWKVFNTTITAAEE